jgi:GTP-binding protein
MHRRSASPAGGDRAGAREERGLTAVRFVGSYPTAAFRLTPPLPEIAFIGRSNAGKSSLINAVAGQRRLAFTSHEPGKTVTANVYSVEGRYYLVDLPGYGYARRSRAERARLGKLVGDYLTRRDPLAGVVWLLDVRRDPSPEDLAIRRRLADRDTPTLVAVTKADKFPRARRTERRGAIRDALGLADDQVILTSAHTGDGIATLVEAVDGLVGGDGSRPR